MSGIGFEDDPSKKTLFPAVNDAFNDFQLPDRTRRVSQVIDDALDSVLSDMMAEWGAEEISQTPDVSEARNK